MGARLCATTRCLRNFEDEAAGFFNAHLFMFADSPSLVSFSSEAGFPSALKQASKYSVGIVFTLLIFNGAGSFDNPNPLVAFSIG
jgi:hypothetical protein